MININKIQRNILLIVAGLLSIFLLIEIDSEGLEDSHWIIVVLIIGALLFSAFSSKSESSVSSPTDITSISHFASNRDENYESDTELVSGNALNDQLTDLKKSLGWSVVISTVIDQLFRSVASNGKSTGLNIGLFALAAGAIYFTRRYSLKRSPKDGYISHTHWLAFYWISAIIIMVLTSSRY